MTDEQKVQQQSVTTAALHNLDLVIDQLTSLDNARYDIVLDSLDSAKTELKEAVKDL